MKQHDIRIKCRLIVKINNDNLQDKMPRGCLPYLPSTVSSEANCLWSEGDLGYVFSNHVKVPFCT